MSFATPMTASGDPSDVRDQVHRGHDLEAGVLQRVREWPDVFPWVRLGRVMRVAGSPPLLLAVAIVLAVWASSLSWLDADGATGSAVRARAPETNRVIAVVLWPFEAVWGPAGVGWLGRLWRIAWSLILWAPVALLLVRQGALLCAGRGMTGLVSGVMGVVRRTPAAWLAAVLPLVGVVLVGLPILLAGWLARFATGSGWWELPTAVLVALVATACGLLGFGALAAVPLSWAAIANEPAPDPLDALSRGYEYLCRRPLQLVLYLAIGLLLVTILWALAWGVALAGEGIAVTLLQADRWGAGVDGPAGRVARAASGLIRFLPTVVAITLSWGLVGGGYLLLRRDAGGQEVEDLWQPPPRVEPPLPPLEV